LSCQDVWVCRLSVFRTRDLVPILLSASAAGQWHDWHEFQFWLSKASDCQCHKQISDFSLLKT
jgi:hypothetical protein